MPSPSFDRIAGLCALLAGLGSLAYALAFLVLRNSGLSALVLLLVGLLSATALVAVYLRLRETEAAFALLAFLLSLTGSLGAAIHGGDDLALALHPVRSAPALPNPIDPRGLLSFGVTGLGVGLFAWLMVHGGPFSPRLGYLGFVSADLLLILYLARLIVLDATSPVVVVPAVLSGFVANPAWYIWLGLELWRGR
ncbi:MAG TPA: hypothetical protein VKF37_01505 [Chloroflexota bacterium]|nr:hypothetical protein [Chloroflexota bacterium]